MTSIETYQERIAAIKASVETLKNGGPLTIHNLPGRADIVVRNWDDFDFPNGAVIAGDEARVYMRVPHGATYWVSSSPIYTEARSYGCGDLYDHLCERASAGEQFRIVHWPSR